MTFTRADLDAATTVVRRHFAATAQFEWPLLSEHVGAEVWVKHENHTPTGAFKVRGGLVYADRARRERPEVEGFVSATRGTAMEQRTEPPWGVEPQTYALRVRLHR